MRPQDDLFWKNEGDAWYARNAQALQSGHMRDHILSLVKKHRLRPHSVLEVGASNGWRLGALRERLPSIKVAVGVEPSRKAVDAGKKQNRTVSFVRATAADIPLKRKFELVIVNFVFHWISREKLLASIAEVDRLTADGGYLVIGDFFPYQPRKNAYSHRKGIFTWKMDYAALFEGTGNYERVERVVWQYSTGKKAKGRVSSDDRAVTTVLRKKLGVSYRSGTYALKQK